MSLDEVCPEHLKEDWLEVNNKISAFSKSMLTARIDTSKYCIFDLIPEKSILKFLNIKDQITKYVFNNFDKPKCYDHLLSASRLVDEISESKVNIDYDQIKKDSYIGKVRVLSKKISRKSHNVSYDLFKTRTGRLTTKKQSFPILTLDKDLRKYIKPNNDMFVELDINGAEIRTLLSLLGLEQPEVDIHEWNAKNVYRSLTTRDEAKKRFFAWLYNPASDDFLSARTYDRDAIKEKFWDGSSVTTPFHRNILSDEYHAVNYILQSTSSDVCLEQAYKVQDMLKGKKSKIVFLMHDSVIIDCSVDDKSEVSSYIEAFQDTRFGKYKANVSIGKSFGEMRKIEWK